MALLRGLWPKQGGELSTGQAEDLSSMGIALLWATPYTGGSEVLVESFFWTVHSLWDTDQELFAQQFAGPSISVGPSKSVTWHS